MCETYSIGVMVTHLEGTRNNSARRHHIIWRRNHRSGSQSGRRASDKRRSAPLGFRSMCADSAVDPTRSQNMTYNVSEISRFRTIYLLGPRRAHVLLLAWPITSALPPNEI